MHLDAFGMTGDRTSLDVTAIGVIPTSLDSLQQAVTSCSWEIEVRDARSSLAVRLEPKGPRVVDVEATLTLGASLGAFRA